MVLDGVKHTPLRLLLYLYFLEMETRNDVRNPRLKSWGFATLAKEVLQSPPDQTQPGNGLRYERNRYVGMSCQSQPLRLQVKQVYKGYASACNVKPLDNFVEAHITWETRG
jgi:hypothetical protein